MNIVHYNSYYNIEIAMIIGVNIITSIFYFGVTLYDNRYDKTQ